MTDDDSERNLPWIWMPPSRSSADATGGLVVELAFSMCVFLVVWLVLIAIEALK